MKARALAVRILHQLRHDKRTLALMMAAPLLMLTLMYYIFETSTSTPTVAIINAPSGFSESMETSNVIVMRMTEGQAREALEAGEIVAFINVSGGKAYVKVDGSQTGDTRAALAAVQVAGLRAGNARSDLQTSGTLEKLLSMPIKRWEIVLGYVMGFGTVTVLQSFLISWFSIYILDLALVGSFVLVLLIILLAAMVALTFGIMCSTAANSEFQMMQFIPVVIIPQIFFSGLFDLSSWLEIIEKTVPLYYVTDALTKVMVKGAGIDVIAVDLAVIAGFCVFFMALNARLLKKYRRI